MAILKILVCMASLIALYTQAGTVKMDKQDTINGVAVKSGKVDSVRTYQGHITKLMPFPLESVRKGVMNFEEKCNNKYKDKRLYTDKNANCKYHNENIVESFVIRDIKSGWTKDDGEVDRYVIGRQVYNRGSFSYYEIIKVIEGKNSQGQKTVTVLQKMLSNKEAQTYVDPKFESDTAFDASQGTFTLTQIGPKETELTYVYESETDHWILNKEVSVPQVFSSISKSINDLVKTVDVESSIHSRDLASVKQ